MESQATAAQAAVVLAVRSATVATIALEPTATAAIPLVEVAATVSVAVAAEALAAARQPLQPRVSLHVPHLAMAVRSEEATEVEASEVLTAQEAHTAQAVVASVEEDKIENYK